MIFVRKIVPFNNVLQFNTDVSEITSISLEHDIKKAEDAISGTFYISGEYKITDGLLEKEPFKFDLPFDIALGNKYNMDSLDIDIDDFRYELVGHNELKVNIDLYLDGEIIPDEPIREVVEEPVKTEITESLDLLDELLPESEAKNEEPEDNIDVDNQNENVNIFNAFNEEEKYATYRVYTVEEDDNLDKILEKYQVTKEELAKYNILDNLKPGDKLIIPTSDK